MDRAWIQSQKQEPSFRLIDARDPHFFRRARVQLYKVEGYPAGVGALVARRDALADLSRPWFAGGTVDCVSVTHERHQLTRGVQGFRTAHRRLGQPGPFPWQSQPFDGLADDFTSPALSGCLNGRSVGALRVSFGMGALTRDVDRFLAFLATCPG